MLVRIPWMILMDQTVEKYDVAISLNFDPG